MSRSSKPSSPKRAASAQIGRASGARGSARSPGPHSEAPGPTPSRARPGARRWCGCPTPDRWPAAAPGSPGGARSGTTTRTFGRSSQPVTTLHAWSIEIGRVSALGCVEIRRKARMVAGMATSGVVLIVSRHHASATGCCGNWAWCAHSGRLASSRIPSTGRLSRHDRAPPVRRRCPSRPPAASRSRTRAARQRASGARSLSAARPARMRSLATRDREVPRRPGDRRQLGRHVRIKVQRRSHHVASYVMLVPAGDRRHLPALVPRAASLNCLPARHPSCRARCGAGPAARR